MNMINKYVAKVATKVWQNTMASAQVIVIAIDMSDQAEAAYHWYVENLHNPHNTVVLVHCPEIYDLAMYSSVYLAQGTFKDVWEKEDKKIKALHHKYEELLKENKVEGKWRTEIGEPGEMICQVAVQENATLVITGSRGLNDARRTVLGSVSDFVLHHCHVPVCICPSAKHVHAKVKKKKAT